MKTMQAKRLTKENFSKYGAFEDLYAPQTMGMGVGTDNAFYPDVLAFDFGTAHAPSVCVCHVKRRDMVITNYEYHNNGCEGILSLDSDIVIFAGFGFPPLLPAQLEAFLVPKGTLVRLKPGVLHGTQFPVDQEQATVIVMLPQRTFATDFAYGKLNEAEQLRITLGEEEGL